MTGPLRAAVDRGRASGGNLAGELAAAAGLALTDAGEARALDDALAAILATDPPDPAALRPALGLMQAIDGQDAFDLLEARSVPRLGALVARSLESNRVGDPEPTLFALKVLAMYQSQASVALVARTAAHRAYRDHPLWPIVFRAFDAPHPHRRELADALAADPPEGAAGVAAVDFGNALVRSGELVFHPYDNPRGHARLAAWIEAPSPADPAAPTVPGLDPAATAAAALAHVGGAGRDGLLGLGLVHAAPRVRLEAAAAAARLGREPGVKALASLCEDVNHSHAARAALEALGRDDEVPPSALAADFSARAEFADWLAHPLEYGRPPDELATLDARELDWPPTNDRRRLTLVRYAYAGGPAGVGLVGSVTFELRGETSPDMDPMDLYALHCCWELQVAHDPRAPQRRSVAAGRRLLGLPDGAHDLGERGVR